MVRRSSSPGWQKRTKPMTSHAQTEQNTPMQRSFGADIARTWSLAWPVFMVHLTFISISTIDVIMVGRSSTDELAYLGIGRVLYWMAITICAGLLTGVTVFTAKKDGAGTPEQAGAIFRQGAVYALVLAIIWTLVLVFVGEPLLRALSLPEALVREGADYIILTSIGLPFQLYLLASFLFLEGISRPRPGMVITLLTLPLNTAMNWLFIEGNLGAPALGASGAALATSLAQVISAALIFLYLRQMHDRSHWGLNDGKWKSAWREGVAMRRFGYAPGFATGMEFLGFNALNVMTGYLGVITISAYQVMFSLHAMSFAIAMGFASATAVRVGNAMGRKDFKSVGWQVKLSTLLTAAAMFPFVALYLSAPSLAVAPFGVDADVAILAAALLVIIAPFLILDGIQYMLVYALRAAGDEVFASVLQVGSFLFVMAGSGAIFTFALGFGAPGITYGMASGITCAALLLGLRFLFVQRKLSAAASP